LVADVLASWLLELDNLVKTAHGESNNEHDSKITEVQERFEQVLNSQTAKLAQLARDQELLFA
jgi:hypothetical protein